MVKELALFRRGQQTGKVSRNAVQSYGEHERDQASKAASFGAPAVTEDRQLAGAPHQSSLLIKRLRDRLLPDAPGRPDHRIIEPVHRPVPREQRAIRALPVRQ